MPETKTLTEEIQELKSLMTTVADEKKPKDKKPREFRLPGRARISKARSKKNYVTVEIIKENGDVSFTREQIQDQTIMIDGTPRIATADVIHQYKGKPIMILPSWSVKPFSRVDSYQDTERQLLNIKGYKVLMNRIKSEAILSKKSISWWWIIGGLVVIGVVIYFFMQSGGKPPVPGAG